MRKLKVIKGLVMDTWYDLITDGFGGPKKFSDVTGIDYGSARMMAQRNFVHPRHWQVIVARAPQSGLDWLDFAFLVSLKSGKATHPHSTRRAESDMQEGCEAQ